LQVGYYRLSREHKELVIAQAEELAAQEAPLPGQENQENSGAERGVAPDNKPDGME
jgi:hypothetical protein